MKQSFVLTAIFVAFIACEKKQSNYNLATQVRITATNYVTGTPFEDLRVYINIYDDHYFFIDGDEVIADTVLSEGYLDLNFNAHKSKHYDYYVSFILPSNVSEVSMPTNQSLVKGELNEFNLSVIPDCWISINLLNTACFDDSDWLTMEYDHIDYPEGTWPHNDYNIGCDSKTIPVEQFPSGGFAFHWQVTKNSITNDYYDTLYVAAFDTVTYTINY